MIREVNIKDIDYSARYLYPNRRIEIKTSEKNIITPLRAATSYEYSQKAIVPTDIPINNPISIGIETLNHSRFQKLMQTNTFFSKLKSKIELNDRMSQYSDLRLVLLKPTKSPKRDRFTNEIILHSPMTLLENDSNLRDRFLRFIIRLQQEAGLNPITIPFLNLSLQTFKDVTTQIAQSLERINRQPLFFLDMYYNEFESAVDWVINQLQSNAVGIYYRPFSRAPLTYEVLSRYIDRDVVFISAQIRRYDENYNDISTMHYLPFFGNDVYAVATPAPFFIPKNGTRSRPRDPLESIRLFDRDSLRINRIGPAESTLDDLEYQYRDDSLITSILRNYHEARNDPEKLRILRAFSKISELKDSSLEFLKLQDYVEQSSSRDYIQEKQFLQRTLEDVRNSI